MVHRGGLPCCVFVAFALLLCNRVQRRLCDAAWSGPATKTCGAVGVQAIPTAWACPSPLVLPITIQKLRKHLAVPPTMLEDHFVFAAVVGVQGADRLEGRLGFFCGQRQSHISGNFSGKVLKLDSGAVHELLFWRVRRNSLQKMKKIVKINDLHEESRFSFVRNRSEKPMGALFRKILQISRSFPGTF